MCSTQVIPKRRCVVHIEHHTTGVAICNALGAAAAHVDTIERIRVRTAHRCKMIPNDGTAAANARPSVHCAARGPLHSRKASTMHARATKRGPTLSDEDEPTLLHCLVSL